MAHRIPAHGHPSPQTRAGHQRFRRTVTVVLPCEGEQGKAAVAMLAEDGLDLVPGPARASRRGARHGVLGLHPPILPEHPAPTHDGSAGRLRWNAPRFQRQSVVEWAGQTVVFCPWAKAYYQQMKAKGKEHSAILRALAFKWVRVLWTCWQTRVPYDNARYELQLAKRRSPLAEALAPTPIPS